ncbi:MAG: c-type cytochrome [Verrucomicrobiota bacterium]
MPLVLSGMLADAFQLGASTSAPLSPTALAASPDGRMLFIACATANQVTFFDIANSRIVKEVPVPASPLGLALSRDGQQLIVTCAAPESTVCILEVPRARVRARIPAGHTAMAPVLSSDGRTLYLCNRFNDEIVWIDLNARKTMRRLKVTREPVAADVTPDGQRLLVAHHLHGGRADVDVVAASVSVVDTATAQVICELPLPNGSGLLRDVRISPDGRHAVVTHLLSRFHLPTTQIERGWINTSAFSLIDVRAMRLVNTVLLDNIDSGAANPWAAAWSADGQAVLVTHAGTHELSVIDFPGLLAKLEQLSQPKPERKSDYASASRTTADVPNDLSFLVGIRQRVRLGAADRGPRGLALIGPQAYLANYFSDSLSVIDLSQAKPRAHSLSLTPASRNTRREEAVQVASLAAANPILVSGKTLDEATLIRRGEAYFNDATICFQGWQSCASCHSSDARVDGLNWDNLNDGIGNPKNAKSLLQAHQTPPSMWLGVRSNAFVAVRAGIRNSLFTVQPPEVAEALDAYLSALKPIPSPRLVKGKLSRAAARGKALFFDEKVGCADCHKGSHYTDRKLHGVGTIGKFDQPADRFDTPSLIEVWRSAPYLHDGRAANVREVVTTFNSNDDHGATSHLTPQQIDDLVEFVLSL